MSALWACGALILLHDDWLPAGRAAWSAGAYWATATTFATALVLALSFRQSRLAERRLAEAQGSAARRSIVEMSRLRRRRHARPRLLRRNDRQARMR